MVVRDHGTWGPLLRVGTWNLLHGRSVSDGSVDADRLRACVQLLDADVLAIQETDRLQPRSGMVDQAALAAEAMGAPWWRYVPALHGTPGASWRPAVLDDGTSAAGPTYGIGLLSRYPVTRWRVRRFTAPPVAVPLLVPGRPGLTWRLDEPRVAIAAVIRGPRGLMTVAAAHLSTVPGWNARQLLRVARWLADLPAPRFLLGDLNLPGPLPFLLTGWRQLARVRTYPAYRPAVQFDHVLAQGVNPRRVRAVRVLHLPVSDHRAVVVDLAVAQDPDAPLSPTQGFGCRNPAPTSRASNSLLATGSAPSASAAWYSSSGTS